MFTTIKSQSTGTIHLPFNLNLSQAPSSKQTRVVASEFEHLAEVIRSSSDAVEKLRETINQLNHQLSSMTTAAASQVKESFDQQSAVLRNVALTWVEYGSMVKQQQQMISATVDEETAKRLEKLEEERKRRIEMVQQQIQDEEQLRQTILAINAYYDDLERQLLQQHSDAVIQIRQSKNQQIQSQEENYHSREYQLWMSGWRGKMQVMSSVLNQMSVLMQAKNRQMFEIGKAAAISQTIVDTYLAAQKAFTALADIPIVGPALATAAAAAAIAAGMARVQAIKNTHFGGGGGSVAVGGASFASSGAGGRPTGVAPQGVMTPTYGLQQQQAHQPVQITLQVHALHPEALSPEVLQRVADTLAPALHDALSRNGQAVGVMA